MAERLVADWLRQVNRQVQAVTGKDSARVRLGDIVNWQGREVTVDPDGDLPLWIGASLGVEGELSESRYIDIISEGGLSVVRVDVLRYLPGLYIGGGLTYSVHGEPDKADLIIELDYEPGNWTKAPMKITRNYQRSNPSKDHWTPAVDTETRKRVKFPDSWVLGEQGLVFEIGIENPFGELGTYGLEFPRKMSVETIMEASRKKPGLLLLTD